MNCSNFLGYIAHSKQEVGEYFSQGMTVPDDVTLLWADDNWGNVQRLPAGNETQRSGGAGVYYHFDYVGGVRDYKWINTISLERTWEQMHLSWERQAREIWIVNVGDLKPLVSPYSSPCRNYLIFHRKFLSVISWTWHMICLLSPLPRVRKTGSLNGRLASLAPELLRILRL